MGIFVRIFPPPNSGAFFQIYLTNALVNTESSWIFQAEIVTPQMKELTFSASNRGMTQIPLVLDRLSLLFPTNTHGWINCISQEMLKCGSLNPLAQMLQRQ